MKNIIHIMMALTLISVSVPEAAAGETAVCFLLPVMPRHRRQRGRATGKGNEDQPI